MIQVLPENLLLLGKVLRPHGLYGLMRIRSYAQSVDSFLNARNIILEVIPKKFQEFKVISIRPHKKRFLLKLEGLDSIEAAEEFRGADIHIRKDSLDRELENEYFWFELIGLRVFLSNGPCIGILRDILVTGGNDIYVVKDGDKEVLIPALQEVVIEIDLENNKMIIAEIEGLLDLNAV